MTRSKDFFRKQQRHSRVKSQVVVDYLVRWSKILHGYSDSLNYIDLFAGRGEYKTGEPSTPVLLLEEAAKDKILCDKLRCVFNDADAESCEHLRQVLESTGLYSKLAHPVVVTNLTVGELVADRLARSNLPPTFCFIDPCGYKGLSADLVRSVTKSFGCDSLVFFNTSLVNRQLHLGDHRHDLESLFGLPDLSSLTDWLEGPTANRESALLSFFRNRLKEMGIPFSIPLGFNRAGSKRLSHHLVFFSKHRKGLGIMKDVMAKVSICDGGVPLFLYTDGCEDCGEQTSLEIAGPLADLKRLMIERLRERRVSVGKLVEECEDDSLDYTTKSIKLALRELIDADSIRAERPGGKKIRKGTLPDDIIVSFL